MHDTINFGVKGHVLITDDRGEVLVDKHNAIHPQNMARVIARGLANEGNSAIYRIAFGNGGTTTNAAFTVTYKEPNTGQETTVNQTFDSRLHNETYSEIIDDSSTLIGTDPGSADSTGTRPGGSANAGNDPLTGTAGTSGPGVISSEIGFTSNVTITAVLNTSEPSGQSGGGVVSNTEDAFVFDELGLYTDGAPATASNGTHDINVGAQISSNDSGLSPSTTYQFNINIDGGGSNTVVFTTPAGGTGVTTGSSEITYGDLCEGLNGGSWIDSGTMGNSSILITDQTADYPSILGVNTNGFLRFVSDTSGPTSSIVFTPSSGTGANMLTALATTSGSATTSLPVSGKAQGVQNAVTSPTTEQERLLTHLIFAPVLKSPNRTLTIKYTLTVSVAPTVT
jgi:hypothetical protein